MEGTTDGNQVKESESSLSRSCKGCVYYSSIRKSKDRGPLCVGISRTLQLAGDFTEQKHQDRNLKDFKYACVGYSIHKDSKHKDPSANPQEEHAQLPFCIGIEVLMDRRPATATQVPAHAHYSEDGQVLHQPQPEKPAHSTEEVREEFLSRFTRNAGVVAAGVAKNVYRVGSYIKTNIDDKLYPYRRRPK